jgi:hypothetical protein
MRLVLIVIGIACLCAFAGNQKGRKKPPDIEVLESHVRRDTDEIKLDGRVRNTGEKPLRGLVVVFDFLSPEGGVVSSERTEAAEDVLGPGQESSYRAVTGDPPRAVRYSIRAFDAAERELRVANSGPFTIE